MWLKPVPSFKQVLPWAILISAFPALMMVNMLFISIFPSASSDETVSINPFEPSNHTMQSAYVYQSRNPQELFSNFYLVLGSQLAARGQMIAAERLLNQAISYTPNDPMARLNYGVVLESLDKNTEAATQYERAIEISPRLTQAYYNLGLLYDKMGDTDKGVTTLKSALAIEPHNALINYDLGVIYAKVNDFENSARYSHQAVEAKKDFAEAYNNYGYALTHLGQYQKALEAIEKSLVLKPDSPATIDSKGFVLFGLGRYQEALAEYQKALAMDDSIGEIYLHMAQTYEKLQKKPEALQNYEHYLKLTPKALDKESVEAKISELQKP